MPNDQRSFIEDRSQTDEHRGANGGEPLDPVTYQLRVYKGPDPLWHVRRVHLAEAISEPYALDVDLITDDLDVEIDDLLGADAEFEYTRNTYSRRIPGVIERVDFLGVASDRLMVRLHVVPAFKLLGHQVDTRIFQDKTVPEILEEVLGPALGQYGRTLDRSKLGSNYLVRDYCVQYGESDFAFASRLMEEEGIAYVFEPQHDDQEGSAEVLVLVDQTEGKPNSDYREIQGDTLDQIPIITDRPETADCESLRYLEWCRPEQVTKVTTRSFNWKRPDPAALPTAEKGHADPRGRKREVYVPSTRRRIEDYQKRDDYSGTKVAYDEEPLTVRRLQMFSGGQARGQGVSNVTCIQAGGVFELAEHPHGVLSFTRMLVTRAMHSGECPDREVGAEASGVRYQNTFECIPATTPFRPPELTPKPRVHGPQTATVTGPQGEEIHTDVHGRIKVRFHWDRLSSLDDGSSCWVRVAQMWAGPGWGTWFLPRIGMEVVVEFLDGNPDRPLVVGCVYNGRNGTPYPLPEEKTKSTIKSSSSVGGEGFNELRFEDAKGAEEIFIHAQRDQNERVLNNRTRLVKGNEWITVEGNESVRIDGTPVHGDPQGIVQGRETRIDGHDLLDTTHTVRVRAPERIVFEVLGSSIVLEPGSITLQAGDGASLRLDQDALAKSNACSTVELSEHIITNTPASMVVDARDVTVTGEVDVVIKGKAVCLNCDGSGVVVDGSSTVFVGDSYDTISRSLDAPAEPWNCKSWVRVSLPPEVAPKHSLRMNIRVGNRDPYSEQITHAAKEFHLEDYHDVEFSIEPLGTGPSSSASEQEPLEAVAEAEARSFSSQKNEPLSSKCFSDLWVYLDMPLMIPGPVTFATVQKQPLLTICGAPYQRRVKARSRDDIHLYQFSEFTSRNFDIGIISLLDVELFLAGTVGLILIRPQGSKVVGVFGVVTGGAGFDLLEAGKRLRKAISVTTMPGRLTVTMTTILLGFKSINDKVTLIESLAGKVDWSTVTSPELLPLSAFDGATVTTGKGAAFYGGEYWDIKARRPKGSVWLKVKKEGWSLRFGGSGQFGVMKLIGIFNDTPDVQLKAQDD